MSWKIEEGWGNIRFSGNKGFIRMSSFGIIDDLAKSPYVIILNLGFYLRNTIIETRSGMISHDMSFAPLPDNKDKMPGKRTLEGRESDHLWAFISSSQKVWTASKSASLEISFWIVSLRLSFQTPLLNGHEGHPWLI
jgi:hypothetical protein